MLIKGPFLNVGGIGFGHFHASVTSLWASLKLKPVKLGKVGIVFFIQVFIISRGGIEVAASSAKLFDKQNCVHVMLFLAFVCNVWLNWLRQVTVREGTGGVHVSACVCSDLDSDVSRQCHTEPYFYSLSRVASYYVHWSVSNQKQAVALMAFEHID